MGMAKAKEPRVAAVAIRRAFLMDVRRFNSQGRFMLLFVTVGLPALMAVCGAIVGRLGASGIFAGCMFGAFAVIPMDVFMSEQQGRGSAMNLNAVIPVSRAHQVVGRYLLLALLILTFCADEVAFVLARNVAAGGPAWTSVDTRYLVGAFACYLVYESVLIPLLYHFPIQRLASVLIVGIIVLTLGVVTLTLTFVVLTGSRLAAVMDALSRFVDVMSAHAGAAVLLLVLIALVSLGVSMAVSIRVWKSREL